MTVVRLKGLKRYTSKGREYAYHRASGIRLTAEFGTPEFMREYAAIETKPKAVPIGHTVGHLFAAYRADLTFTDLAPKTRKSYLSMLDIMAHLDTMPLHDLTPEFIAKFRDMIAENRGRRTSTYVKWTPSVGPRVCELKV